MSTSELSYQEKMDRLVVPWIKNDVQSGRTQSADGTELQYYYCIHPQAKAAVTIIHGYCEFFGKYHELFYTFYQAGYSVFFLELRGYGKSERLVPEKDHVHINSFEEYVADLRAFSTNVVFPKTRYQKHFLFAHSMGGAVSTLYLEAYPGDYDACVLSSPMLEINFGSAKEWQVAALGFAAKAAKWDTKLIPGHTGWTGTYEFEKSSCLSEERYAYQFNQRMSDPDYQTWSGTYQWVRAARDATKKLQKAASGIKVPVLILQAGNDSMVNNHGQGLFARNCSSARIIVFHRSKHEIYNTTDDILERYYSAIFSFLEKQSAR